MQRVHTRFLRESIDPLDRRRLSVNIHQTELAIDRAITPVEYDNGCYILSGSGSGSGDNDSHIL